MLRNQEYKREKKKYFPLNIASFPSLQRCCICDIKIPVFIQSALKYTTLALNEKLWKILISLDLLIKNMCVELLACTVLLRIYGVYVG